MHLDYFSIIFYIYYYGNTLENIGMQGRYNPKGGMQKGLSWDCIANAFTKQINDDSRMFGKHLLLWKDKPQPMADQELLEDHYNEIEKDTNK